MDDSDRPDPRLVQLAEELKCINVDELLDAAIARIPRLVQGRFVSIHLLDDTRTSLVLERANHQRATAKQIRVDDFRHLVLEAFRREQPVLIPDIVAYVAQHGLPVELDRRTRMSSGCMMLIPITAKLPPRAEPQAIGVLEIADKTDFTIFGKTDLRFAASVGGLLGEAIVNTQIIQSKVGGQREELKSELDALKSRLDKQQAITSGLEEARRRVELLLPTLPELPDARLHVRYRSLETIAGEFYDVIDLGSGRLALVLGEIDVQGIEAALIMAMTKQVLGVCAKTQSGPAAALVRAHHELRTSLGGVRRIEAQLALLDREAGRLVLARGGRCLPLLYRADATPRVVPLEPPGEALGRIDDDRFARAMSEASYDLQAGDQLLLYSTGAVTASPAGGDPYGRAQLEASFERHAALGPAEQLAAIAAEIRAHAGIVEGAENWTLLVVHYTGRARSAVSGGATSSADPRAEASFATPDWLDDSPTVTDIPSVMAAEADLDAAPAAAADWSEAPWSPALTGDFPPDAPSRGDSAEARHRPAKPGVAGQPVAPPFGRDAGRTEYAVEPVVPAIAVPTRMILRSAMASPPSPAVPPPPLPTSSSEERGPRAVSALLAELARGDSLASLDPVELAVALGRREELLAEVADLARQISADRHALIPALDLPMEPGLASDSGVWSRETVDDLADSLDLAISHGSAEELTFVLLRLAVHALAPR